MPFPITNPTATRTILIQTLQDWKNNYLSVEKFAEHYGLHIHQAIALLELCISVDQSQHPEM